MLTDIVIDIDNYIYITIYRMPFYDTGKSAVCQAKFAIYINNAMF
ncbi:hypothetical protein TREPR_3128 [Treponema primitia ZAS-2]|uniref:Uncharacterized protein n=1 Tax=Treponema primitia (strain ATCC BAA-887 / DSM 12427 / ZAS-2) TaxID=545694 RepID=F5YLV1_TREPZ|nr:hypothetical protein TREPR_3128 [Treponema primitia ZAS-2]